MIRRREVFIHARQCCPNMQLSIRDPNRRQKEKDDVLKQRRRQVKLKGSVGFCDLHEEEGLGQSRSPPELRGIPGMTRGVHQEDTARC